MYYAAQYPSPVGMLTLASDGDHLVGLWMEGQQYFGKSLPESPVSCPDLPVFSLARTWLDGYFAGERPPAAALPLRPLGSAFRQEVWRLLREIPYGRVVTYGELAEKMAARMNRSGMSSRAVGGAVGHNPLSILIPCHRVVGAHGSLTGYAGGVERKRWLLEWEGVDLSRLTVPKTGTAL